MRRIFMSFFFFFQAEDGIRDDLVTGVQTCALPILLERIVNNGSAHERDAGRVSAPCGPNGGHSRSQASAADSKQEDAGPRASPRSASEREASPHPSSLHPTRRNGRAEERDVRAQERDGRGRANNRSPRAHSSTCPRDTAGRGPAYGGARVNESGSRGAHPGEIVPTATPRAMDLGRWIPRIARLRCPGVSRIAPCDFRRTRPKPPT